MEIFYSQFSSCNLADITHWSSTTEFPGFFHKDKLKQVAGLAPRTGDHDANDALDILKQSVGVTNQAKKEEVVMGIVTCTGVRVRKGPGTNYAVVTRVNKGNTVRIWKEQNGWSMVDTGKWVCSKYIKKC